MKSVFSSRTIRKILTGVVLLTCASTSVASTQADHNEAALRQIAIDSARITENAAHIRQSQLEVDNAMMKHQLAIALVEGHAAAQRQAQPLTANSEAAGKTQSRNVQEAEKLEELTLDHLKLIDRVWEIDQIRAMVTLRKLVVKMEKSGLTDDERTASWAYWLLANAIYANQLSCDMAYQALYKSVVLGFVSQWPQEFGTYQNFANALHKCVPAEKRDHLMADAQEAIDKTPLRNRVNAALAAKAGLTANAQSTQEPVRVVGGLVTLETVVKEKIDNNLPEVIGIGIFVVSLIIAYNIVKQGQTASGTSGGTPSGSSGRASATAHPVASVRQKRKVATSKRRVGLQRMNPW